MAISLPEPQLADPYGGLDDLLVHRRLRTPLDPEVSFLDDPLRMMRAARFMAGLGLEPDPALVAAATELAGRLEVVSAERIRDELSKLLVVADPSPGLWFLVRTGLADEFLPELPGLALEQDPIHHHKDVLAHTIAVVAKTRPELIVRLAALLHDVGKPKTRSFGPEGVSFHLHDVVGARMAEERLRALRFPKDTIEAVTQLVLLHLRFHTYKMGWTDKAIRRYVRDAGPASRRPEPSRPLRLHDPQPGQGPGAGPADGRPRGPHRRPGRPGRSWPPSGPALDGHRVMELLGVPPGRVVGEALTMLLDARIDEGPDDRGGSRGPAPGLGRGARPPALAGRRLGGSPSATRCERHTEKRHHSQHVAVPASGEKSEAPRTDDSVTCTAVGWEVLGMRRILLVMALAAAVWSAPVRGQGRPAGAGGAHPRVARRGGVVRPDDPRLCRPPASRCSTSIPAGPAAQALAYAPAAEGQHIPDLAGPWWSSRPSRRRWPGPGTARDTAVDIVGYSMGGLVARYLIEHPGADGGQHDRGWFGDGPDVAGNWADASTTGHAGHSQPRHHGRAWVPGHRRRVRAVERHRAATCAPAPPSWTSMGGAEPAGRALRHHRRRPAAASRSPPTTTTATGWRHGYDGLVPAESPFLAG